MFTPSPAILLNSAVDSDPAFRPSVRIQLKPVLNLSHFLRVVDIIGKGVSVWTITPFQAPGVSVGGRYFLSSAWFPKEFILDLSWAQARVASFVPSFSLMHG